MPLRLDTPLPALSGATFWFNGEARREELLGHPVLVYFWSISCHICHDNMARLAQWRETYGPQGLKLVAIHEPRQSSDMNPDIVRKELAKYQISEPCGVDNTHAVTEAFQNQILPAYYLFDRQTAGCRPVWPAPMQQPKM